MTNDRRLLALYHRAKQGAAADALLGEVQLLADELAPRKSVLPIYGLGDTA